MNPTRTGPRCRAIGSGLIICAVTLALVACGGGEPRSPGAMTSSTPATDSSGGETSPERVGPSDAGPSDAGPPGVRPEGFSSVSVRVLAGASAAVGAGEICVWEAATHDQRTRGLMGVTDLAGRAGMLFVYDEDRRTSFTMRNTVMPLSIAFFDADGLYMEAFDMEPCGAEPCPRYPTPDGFRLALEVPAGDLARWGVGPGTRLQRGTGCHTPSS